MPFLLLVPDFIERPIAGQVKNSLRNLLRIKGCLFEKVSLSNFRELGSTIEQFQAHICNYQTSEFLGREIFEFRIVLVLKFGEKGFQSSSKGILTERFISFSEIHGWKFSSVIPYQFNISFEVAELSEY